jgi:hypothetical protein
MKYKIIDNFLSQDEFVNIKEDMLGSFIPWAYNPYIVTSDDKSMSHYNYQFTHTFYRGGRPSSDRLDILKPILELINPSAIVRVKANLITRTENQVVHGFHLDHPNFDGKIAIFYINTNDGYTILDDGTKIESIENRLLILDPKILHAGTTCTDQQVRCLINFMYYSWTNSDL